MSSRGLFSVLPCAVISAYKVEKKSEEAEGRSSCLSLLQLLKWDWAPSQFWPIVSALVSPSRRDCRRNQYPFILCILEQSKFQESEVRPTPDPSLSLR
jgi:hypothetical protein